MKKLSSAVFAATLLAATAGLASVPVIVDQVSGYFDPPGTGEFNVSPVQGGIYAPVVLYNQSLTPPAAGALGNAAFCVDRYSPIGVPWQYDATVDTSGFYIGKYGNRQITLGTAWLYKYFASGTLPNYNYTPGVSLRESSAYLLQVAIRVLEGMYSYITTTVVEPPINPPLPLDADLQADIDHNIFLAQVAAAFNGGVTDIAGLKAAMVRANNPNGVGVLNLTFAADVGGYKAGDHAQSLLLLIPCTVTIQCPPGGNLGCNPQTLPDCTSEKPKVTATSCGQPLSQNQISCSVSETIGVDCKVTRTLRYVATDAQGNSASCDQVFTYKSDTVAPTLIGVPADLTLSCGDPLPTTPVVTATDTCVNNPPVTYSQTISGSGCSQVITRTWSASDGCNTTTKSQTIKFQGAPPVGPGDTATIGFWHNKNGQALIKKLNGGGSSTALGNWLASTYPCLFGSFAGLNNSQVASKYSDYFYTQGQKTFAQILATALACYATSSTLAGGNYAASYGFNVSLGGTGTHTYNVGSNGAAVGLSNNTSYTVFALLAQANLKCLFTPGSAVGNAFNSIFDGINSSGDIK